MTPDNGVTFTWSGDVDLALTTGATITFAAPATPGAGELHVTATNERGETQTATVPVTVLPVHTTFTAPIQTTINRPITATALPVDGLAYAWTATGGTITAGATTATLGVDAPAAPGPFVITLMTTNEIGDSASTTAQVVVAAAGLDIVAGTIDAPGPTDSSAGLASKFSAPKGLAFSSDGKLYVSDSANNALRVVEPSANYATSTIVGLTLNAPDGIAFHPDTGRIYIADTGNHCIRWYDPSNGSSGVLAGLCGTSGTTDNTDGANARFTNPTDVTFGGANRIFVAEYGGNSVRAISLVAPYHVSSVVPALPSCSGSMNGTGGPGGTARIACPQAAAYRADGALLVGQSGSGRFMVDTSAATLDTCALTSAHSGRFVEHVAVDRRGDFYVTAAGDETQHYVERWRYASTSLSAHDAAGASVTSAIGNGTSAIGNPLTFGGAFGSPNGIAVDPITGDLFVTSSAHNIIVRVRQP